MENNDQKPFGLEAQPDDARTAPAVLPSASPAWVYMTYLEAVLLSAALLVLQLLSALLLAGLLKAIEALPGWSPESFVSIEPHFVMLVNVFAVVPLLVWGWWRSGQSVPETFGLRAFPGAVLLATVPLSIGAALILSEMDNLLRQVIPLQNELGEIFESLSSSPLVAFVALVIIAPITEEALFRGMILRGLLRRYGPWRASLVSALLFGLVHVYPAQIMPAFLLGLLLAAVHLRTGSLWPCVWMHAVVNALFFVAHMRFPHEIQGLTTPPEEGLFQPLWLDALAVALFGIGVASLFLVTLHAPVRKASEA